MSYFPCNSGVDLTIDGVPHRGGLKLRNEYIPAVLPVNIIKSSTSASSYFCTNDAIVLNDDIILLAALLGSGGTGGGTPLRLEDGQWKKKNNKYLDIHNRFDMNGDKNCCYVGKELYFMTYNSYISIYKLNADLTTTLIATKQRNTQYYYVKMGYFKNGNGEDCLVIYDSYSPNTNSYYNLTTQTWTEFTHTALPMTFVKNIYYSGKPNVIWWNLNADNSVAQNYLYEYDMTTDKFTNITRINNTQTDNTFAIIDKIYNMMPIDCNEKRYFLAYCLLDTHYSNSNWQTKTVYCIVNNDRDVIATIEGGFGSPFEYKGGIGFFQISRPNTPNTSINDVTRFYRFDPETKILYDLSIPHLVVDNS